MMKAGERASEADAYVPGTLRLVRSEAVIELPGHFRAVVSARARLEGLGDPD